MITICLGQPGTSIASHLHPASLPSTILADASLSLPNTHLFQQQQLVDGGFDAAGNFAVGYYKGHEVVEGVLEGVRHILDGSDGLEGFIIVHSYSGGTGSGIFSSLVQKLATKYPKPSIIPLSIHPEGKMLPQCYNTILAYGTALQHLTIQPILHNKAILQQISPPEPPLKAVTMRQVNHVIGQLHDSLTISSRRNRRGLLHDIGVNVARYPTMKLAVPSITPITACQSPFQSRQAVYQLLRGTSRLINYDKKYGQDMISSRLLIEGKQADLLQAQHIIAQLAKQKKYQSMRVKASLLQSQAGRATLLQNSTCIGHVLNQASKKFDSMYSKRAHVHQYVSEGLDEQEFSESRQSFSCLYLDYKNYRQAQPQQ